MVVGFSHLMHTLAQYHFMRNAVLNFFHQQMRKTQPV